MKKYLLALAIVIFCGLVWAGEQTIRSMYFSQGIVFTPTERIVILKNASVDGTGKVFTVSTTNYIILDYTIPADVTEYQSTIIVGGELK